MQMTAGFFCEELTERDGKIDIRGMQSVIFAQRFPLTTAPLTVVVFVEASTAEGPDHVISIHPLNEDANPGIGGGARPVKFTRLEEGHPYGGIIPFRVRPTLTEAGDFELEVRGDGTRLGTVALKARLIPPTTG